ncbi:M23 family metallopeptidase [Anoxybacterium hadale]|uniref:M23 family metallopeptidase n=1 Tax=Anoxybacterium hadale TaxID=3408580 RepID=A0ACD1AFN0_9FIRM|nr:M23 family metallopeptidase [Clostridiales bacterium]
MHRFVSFTKKLKWFGLLGLLGYVTPYENLKLLWLIWLLCFFEIIAEWRILCQSMLQLIGIFAVNLRPSDRQSLAVSTRTENCYRLPFTGQWTVVNGGIDKEMSHSWSIPAQRYAYDFLILDEEGKSHMGDPRKPESYYCYNRDILAPCDGTVLSIQDGYEDSLIDGKGSADCRAKDIRGNHILISHGDNEYSLIAHIKKNSFLVGIGDMVTRGQVMAKCGNSGNSSEPHIHYQLQDGESFYFSSGMPVGFCDIKAEKKANYSSLDPRKVHDRLVRADDITYIQRGWAVENLQP